MTTRFLSDPLLLALSLSAVPLSANTLLAGMASLLLIFVSAGVIYLSAVEWRDRRRRAQQTRQRP